MHSMQKMVSLLSRAHGTPFGYAMSRAIEGGKWGEIPPLLAQVAPTSSFADKQVAALVSKLEGFDVGIDTQRVAEDTFVQCENACRETNIRMTRYVNWFEQGLFCTSVSDLERYQWIQRIRKRIADVLGNVPDLSPRFSNGSTFHDRGDSVTLPHKMSGYICVTRPFEEFGLMEIIRQTAWWPSSEGVIVEAGNRFSVVPKNYKTGRGICIEPSGNLCLQLAAGAHIRKSLYRVGIEIDGVGKHNAQWLHQQLARYGSLEGDLATIDLTNASDMIAELVVRLLLPKQWFALLSALRSQSTYFKGAWRKLSKFSSMGNGFTFELETLLFYAIAVETAGWAKAYGDDLIVPSSKGTEVLESLRFFGFLPNVEKSYLTGPFRESCGGDFWSGRDTRPVYLKKIPDGPLEWIDLHNSLYVMEAKSVLNGTLLADSRELTDVRKLIINQIPSAVRLFVPPKHVGGLWSDNQGLWRRRPARILRKKRAFYWGTGIAEYDKGYDEFKSVVPVSRVIRLSTFDPNAQLASALLGAPSKGVTPRDGTCGFKITWLA